MQLFPLPLLLFFLNTALFPCLNLRIHITAFSPWPELDSLGCSFPEAGLESLIPLTCWGCFLSVGSVWGISFPSGSAIITSLPGSCTTDGTLHLQKKSRIYLFFAWGYFVLWNERLESCWAALLGEATRRESSREMWDLAKVLFLHVILWSEPCCTTRAHPRVPVKIPMW